VVQVSNTPVPPATVYNMTNRQIADTFDELANLLELLDENEFKIRSYRNAYLTLRKLERPLSDTPEAEIKALKGIGPAISSKIQELLANGHFKALDEAKSNVPHGVAEMLEINGFGPKKVRVVWQEMGIESIGELWYACNENRLIEYKGFGLKTQEDLRQRIEYHLRSRHKLHCDAAQQASTAACQHIAAALRGAFVSPVGELRRCCSIVERVEVLVAYNGEITAAFDQEHLILQSAAEQSCVALTADGVPVTIHQCTFEEYGSKLFKLTGPAQFLQDWVAAFPGVSFKSLDSEEALFERVNLPYIAPELRDQPDILAKAQAGRLPQLISAADLKGVLHVHTTWSDGLHSLRQMCERARELGYEYIGITDHSQSAFYANGLKEDRLRQQWAEIDALNAEMAPFKILKGIESDILSDGALDYPDAVLAEFDFVIASVHSNLKMSLEKATERVVKAIQNPYTTILGHPTGRLLLSREGYPLDWEAVFAACVQHNVAIELNAHPYRLDIDSTLIPRALELGIKISINPDAHSLDGLELVRYGVQAARKGGVGVEGCLNAGIWSENI
jgi:DNA polymerase (family X)